MMMVLISLLMTFAVPQDPIAAWIKFERSVRDQTITKEKARRQFPALYTELRESCQKYPFKPHPSWQFPVKNYGLSDVGAGGFRPNIRYGSAPIKGYNFYNGNLHGGHPAYDIFIHDKNQDSIDDRTSKPAPIVAPVDLLILSVETEWTKDSEIRGGRYIWALDPLNDRIFYFAHLNEILVKPGEFCPAGKEIGTVGRTGKNAAPARSPSHLHFMVLDVKGSALTPLDYLPILKKGTVTFF
jgi:hypothetical protein